MSQVATSSDKLADGVHRRMQLHRLVSPSDDVLSLAASGGSESGDPHQKVVVPRKPGTHGDEHGEQVNASSEAAGVELQVETIADCARGLKIGLGGPKGEPSARLKPLHPLGFQRVPRSPQAL